MAGIIKESIKNMEENPTLLKDEDFENSMVACKQSLQIIEGEPVDYFKGMRACIYGGLMTGATVDKKIPNNPQGLIEHSAKARIMHSYHPSDKCREAAFKLLLAGTKIATLSSDPNDDYAACLITTLFTYVTKDSSPATQ